MHALLPKNLIRLAENCPTSLYVVGGSVRDFLAGLSPKSGVHDLDICAPLNAETFVAVAKESGFAVQSVYKHTGTVKLKDTQTGADLEYSCFRSDKYVRGEHTPAQIYFTNDINLDAKRRDFTANAVYFDIKAGEFIDPLGGIVAIKEKRLTTVAPAEKVFSEDGLRLMRLARQAAELGFSPDKDCLLGAMKNAALIEDISPERVFAELLSILRADERFGVQGGHYQGLRLLSKTRVLDYILPELTKGRDMAQRADFHNYDVLEHSLRAVLYAERKIRLAALLHDVGKPLCTLRDGNTYAHPVEGALLAKSILQRLKAPKKLTDYTVSLVQWHMYDMDGKTGENKLRRFFVERGDILQDLLLLKQADFSACKDDLRPAPTCIRWRSLLEKMHAENVPFSLKELRVNGNDLLEAKLPANKLSAILSALLSHVAITPKDNEKTRLISLALSLQNQL